MIIYLAGGVTGNLKALWQNIMKIYLAGTYSREYVVKEAMKIFLAGNDGYGKTRFEDTNIYILESYFYISKQEWMFPLLKHFKGFLLDSGAFTYMTGNGGKVNWDLYIEQYGAFINKHHIELFFELDIDSIVGLKEVERLRYKLEKLTSKQCIPVWHKSRGLDYFKKMITDYKYIAIGGIVTREIKQSEHHIFTNLINLAHSKGCKIHGLGYTNLVGLTKYKFDSVDSTTWLYGNRSGKIYKFNGTSIVTIDKPKGTRLEGKIVAINNFNAWVEFQQYAEQKL